MVFDEDKIGTETDMSLWQERIGLLLPILPLLVLVYGLLDVFAW